MTNIEIRFPPKCAFLFEPHRYKVLHGGRGGGKSHSIAKALLVQGMQTRHRILCTREFQNSIADSVHKLFSDQIAQLGLGRFYTIQQAKIYGANGTEFLFAGIRHNVTSIKSMEGITRCWVEEAEKVSEESWSVLIPTIRVDGSEIWVSFNPHEETDPTYKHFIAAPPTNAVVVDINWQDNDWFPIELAREKDYAYSIDPEAADHVWGGKTRRFSNANVLRGRYVVEPFEPGKDWNGPYQGVDWGYSSDPTTLVRCWVNTAKRELYIEHEVYGVGVEIDNTPELFDRIPHARDYTTRADNARPETISYCQRKGYGRLVAALKGPGSVEDGVEHLRSYMRIVIHPRCIHSAEEARLWSWRVDRLTGDVLPELVDKHNHCWDAIRYALEPLIKQAGLGLLDLAASELAKKGIEEKHV